MQILFNRKIRYRKKYILFERILIRIFAEEVLKFARVIFTARKNADHAGDTAHMTK